MPPEWVDKVTGFITSFTEFLNKKENEELIGYLKGTSGFIALGAGIAKMISDYKESQKTEYEKSITDLFTFLFPFTFDQIKTIIQSNRLNEKDINFNKKELKNELNKYFSVYKSSFISPGEIKSSWLPLHPLIQKFKNETIKWIEDNNEKSKKVADELKRSFEDRIEYDLYTRAELELFRKLAERDLSAKELMKYLDLVIKDYQNTIEQERGKDRSAISNFSEMYVKDRKAIKLTIKDHWNETDNAIYQKYNDKIKNIDDLLDEFLESSDQRKLIIGATYGVGKTTLVKKLAYEYAKKRTEDAKYRIPIIVYLKDKLNIKRSEKEFESLDDFLTDIFEDSDYGKKRISKPVLFIFDALDEYNYSDHQTHDIDEVIRSEILKKIVNKFSDIKVIFTTGLLPDYQKLGNITNNYLRLFPFDEEQVKYFLQQKKSALTYDELKINLDREIITKPLMLSILVEIYPKLEDDFKRLKKEKKRTPPPNLSKTLIYMQMFYDLHYGKSKETIDEQYRNNMQISFIEEKKILRLISYYQKIKKDLTVKELKDWSKPPELKIEPVINTYFNFSTKDKNYLNEEGNRSITFIHQTYQEFLLAEYIIEQYINENILGLNIGKPSDVTIDFLKGFLEMMTLDEIIINEFILGSDNNENNLISSLGYKSKSSQQTTNLLKEIKNKMITTAIKSFNNDTVSILKVENKDEIRNSSNSDKLKWYESIPSDVNNYENLWMHRWISLILLGYLDKEIVKEQLEKKTFERLILFNSHNVPNYVKYLRYADLSSAHLSNANLLGADLSNADLLGADLSNANLSRADLFGADLSNANLLGADLSHAILSRANLFGAILSRAILFGADLSRADLSGANLSNANLSNANLFGADLVGADLSSAILFGVDLSNAYLFGADLLGADLSNANLFNADLFGVDLSNANLSGANLSNANLSGANLNSANLSRARLYNTTLIDSKYENLLIDEETNFTDTIIDDHKFIDHIKQFTSKVPNKIKNQRGLKNKLKERGFPQEIIERLSQSSKLPE